MDTLNPMLQGAVIMAGLTVSLFFLRFWKTTRDRFFLFFSIAFFIESSSRILFKFADSADEYEPLIYTVRLLAFLVILFAIIDKNLKVTRKP
ncbi:MAG: DUF5985 family protein [Micavibrio sp.]